MYVNRRDSWDALLMKLIDRIFGIENAEDFERACIEVFHYQQQNCPIYSAYIKQLNWPHPNSIQQIPFLPIEFFKTSQVLDQSKSAELVFKSSGTGGNRSIHYVASADIYERSFRKTFFTLIGDPREMIILALLPNYIEQGESSLVYMIDKLIQESDSNSCFLLNDHQQVSEIYTKSLAENKQVILFGVTYALLDLCEQKIDLSEAIIIETGGMKGNRPEITKKELHKELSSHLGCKKIYSEYGMTELLSQAYAKDDLIFSGSKWFDVLIRDTNDPFSFLPDGKTGGINIIDLANLHSCSFIATQDLGKKMSNGFEILGRFDHADLRGCNLLVQ